MKFTQLHYPDGARIPVETTGSPDAETKALELIANGWEFQIQNNILKGVIRMWCCDAKGVWLYETSCANDPSVLPAVERLVQTAYANWEAAGKQPGAGPTPGRELDFDTIYSVTGPDAIDHVYDIIMECVAYREYDRISKYMDQYDVSKASLSIAMAFLSCTLPVASKVAGRKDFYEKTAAFIRSAGRSMSLISGLEGTPKNEAIGQWAEGVINSAVYGGK